MECSQPLLSDLDRINKHTTPFSFDGYVLSSGFISCKEGSHAFVLYVLESGKTWKMILWNADKRKELPTLCTYRFQNCKIVHSKDYQKQKIITLDLEDSIIQRKGNSSESIRLEDVDHCIPSSFTHEKPLVGIITDIQQRRKVGGKNKSMRVLEVCGTDGISIDLQCYNMERVTQTLSLNEKIIVFGASQMVSGNILSINQSGSILSLEKNVDHKISFQRNISYPVIATTVHNEDMTIKNIHSVYDMSRIFCMHQESVFIQLKEITFLELYGPYKGFCITCMKDIHLSELDSHTLCPTHKNIEKRKPYLYINVTDASQGYVSLRIGERMLRKLGYESMESIHPIISKDPHKVVSAISNIGRDVTIFCTRWKPKEKEKEASIFYHLVAIK